MGLAHTGRAVDKQGVIDLTGGIGNGNGGAVGKAVGRTHHEIFKGELRIKIHGGGNIILFLVGLHFRVAEHDDLGIGVEYFFQGVFDNLGIAAADDFHPEFRRRVEDQLLLIQLHDLCVIKGIGHDNST